jgi:hypothetical protein
MSLDWKEVECPKCGQMAKVASSGGGQTIVDRYLKCPRCRVKDGDEPLEGRVMMASITIDGVDQGMRVFGKTPLQVMVTGWSILAGAVLLGYVVGRRVGR